MMFVRESRAAPGSSFIAVPATVGMALARRRARFHRRHLLALAREWAMTLLLVVASLWLTALAVFTVLR
jgi:hypothetical protein